jgi:hypothetical protein
MPSSTMLRRVPLVRTDVSEDSASITRVTRIGGLVFLRTVRRLLVTDNNVPSWPILVTVMMEALRSSEMSVLTRATRRNIPEDAILPTYLLECKTNLCRKYALPNKYFQIWRQFIH